MGLDTRTCLANLSRDILSAWPNHCSWDLYLEKWLDIQGFTNFTAAHFNAKSHTVNSWQKSHIYRLDFKIVVYI